MAIDPSFGMGYENFQQTGSFNQPVSPPIDPWDGGTLVALPCINVEWLRLLLGAASQLINPSSWDPALSDSARVLVLQRATDLLAGLAALDTCVSPVVQVAIDCTNGLQYKTADGIWHVGTSMADICTCTTGCIVSPTPPNPGGVTTNQQACNLAGFLASEIIQKAMIAMESYVGTMNEQAAYAHDLTTAIAFAFPITSAFANAAYSIYQIVSAQILAQVTAAATDPILWSRVTCAIYNGILPTGYVTPANFATVQANLHAVSYPFFWTPNAIGNFWGELGVVNVQAMQNVGALDDVDCTDCANWCAEWDYTISDHGAGAPLVGLTNWQSGVGWVGPFNSSTGHTELGFFQPLGLSTAISAFDVWLISPGGEISGFGLFELYSGSTQVLAQDMSVAANSSLVKYHFTLGSPITADKFGVVVLSPDNHGQNVCAYVQLHGAGATPFPTMPCVHT